MRYTGAVVIQVDPRYYRPVESAEMVGDATKAKNILGWSPQTSFRELVSKMAKADMALMKA